MKAISLEDLEKSMIRDNCDEGCGYLDERDLKDISVLEVIPISKVEEYITNIDNAVIKSDSCESEYTEAFKLGAQNIVDLLRRYLERYQFEEEENVD